ncbi:MAG: glycosyltransferase [Actinomycetota bacterium]
MIDRLRARARTEIRRRGVRAPRAYWLGRYGLARALAASPMGAAARRERETVRDAAGEPRLPPRGRPVKPVVLFYAINGAGLGHVSRCLAIARHLRSVTPVFVTTSTRAPVLDRYGIPYRFVPSWDARASARARWNERLRSVLLEELDRHRPAIVVFDGVAPDVGLVQAWRARPEIGRVAIRRAYRLDGREIVVTARDAETDLLIVPHDPGSAAVPVPRGPVARAVGPIAIVGPEDAMSREDARASLGIRPDARAALVQLGAGALGGSAGYRERLVDELVAAGIAVAITRYEGARAGRVHEVDRYPIAEVLPAFDAAIGAAGYNTFVELMLHGVPAVLVPNEDTRSDDQGARARAAAEAGAAFVARDGDVAAMVEHARAMLGDDDLRARMSASARALVPRNGAPEAAAVLEAYCARILARRPATP